MIVITGSVLARSETLKELTAVCIAHSARSRGEPGCIAHNCHVDCENPLRIFFYEQWADRDAIATHFRVPESLAFMGDLRRLGDVSAAMGIYETTPIKI